MITSTNGFVIHFDDQEAENNSRVKTTKGCMAVEALKGATLGHWLLDDRHGSGVVLLFCGPVVIISELLVR